MRQGWHVWSDGWMLDPPPADTPIAIWRPEFPQEYVVMRDDLRAEMNIHGLYWRLWPYD